ncbi:MAG: amino acid adenylation domain-containing protein, partial [Psychrosphaera sp.]|nr:amino acid adenylation domain-containing protein [Psychrosphaera sp.]
MNLTNCQWEDLGKALTRQQRLLALTQGKSQGNSQNAGVRYFWLTFNALNPDNAKVKLQQLMQQHESLCCDYGMPQGLDVLRSQVQPPRLDFRVYDDLLRNQAAIEKQAKLVFEQNTPHLLAWVWPGHPELRAEVKVLLAGPALSLDDHSAYAIYQLLNNNSSKTGVPEVQYDEYSDWINQLMNDEGAQEGIYYWQGLSITSMAQAQLNEQLSTAKQPFVAHSLRATLPETLQQEPQIMLNVWAALLGRLCGSNELIVHYFHDCRADYEELENSLGLFAQPLPIPFYQLGENDLQSACRGTEALLDEMLEYQEYVQTLDKVDEPDVAKERHAGFYWHRQNQLSHMSGNGLHTDCQILLHYTQTDEGDAGLTLRYNANRYSEQAISRLLQRYQILLQKTVESPQLAIKQIRCLLEDEQPKAVTQQPIEHNFVSLFAQQAKAYPHKIALQVDQKQYSYRQLDQLSDQYAGALQQAGAAKDTIVALALPRGAQMMICLLAVLKSGAAYLPLDPDQPQARLQQIIDDANPAILVSELTTLNTNTRLTVAQLQQNQASFEPVDINLQQLAYVLYTSGSSGQPKGVQAEHRQLIHYAQAVTEQLALPQHGHYGLISTLVADLGNTMLFPAWLTGSCVHLLGQTSSLDCVKLDCLKIVPSHLEALLYSNDLSILPSQVLVLGGEPITNTLMQQLKAMAPKCRIYNHYGPTETTVGVMFSEIDLAADNTRLTTAIGDNQIYILDDHQQPVASGQCGEIYVAGSNVTRGYLNDQKRNAQVYLDNPFGGGRMYKTGDLAVRHADDSIEIVGRSDSQIKIRGFRLDLGEIQTVLASHPQVSQANLQLEGQGETAKLLAFVVVLKGAEKGQTVDEKQLSDYLAERLPQYMIPANIYQRHDLPLNANGKIDRKRLLDWALKQNQQPFVPATNVLQAQLICIWQNVLQHSKIGITDDFFELGGHSLAAIKVIAKIRQKLHYQLPNDLLFHHTTVAKLAKYLDERVNTQSQRLVPLAKADSKHTMVLMHSLAGHFNYHKQLIANLSGHLDVFGITPNADLWLANGPQQMNIIVDDYVEQLLPLKQKPLLLAGWSLGAKMMVMLAKRMLALGFDVTAVAVLDFDLAQQLNDTDDAKQLINDFKVYLEAESITMGPDQLNQILQSDISGNYRQAMTQLLSHPAIKPLIGDEASNRALTQSFLMRWQIKQNLYQTDTPI